MGNILYLPRAAIKPEGQEEKFKIVVEDKEEEDVLFTFPES